MPWQSCAAARAGCAPATSVAATGATATATATRHARMVRNLLMVTQSLPLLAQPGNKSTHVVVTNRLVWLIFLILTVVAIGSGRLSGDETVGEAYIFTRS